MAILGADIFIKVGEGSGATVIAGVRSTDIQQSCGVLEKSSPTAMTSREFLADRSEWGFSTGYLMLTGEDVKNLLQVRQTVHIQVVTREGTSVTVQLEGDAIITKCQITGVVGNLAQGSFQFQGTGELAEAT